MDISQEQASNAPTDGHEKPSTEKENPQIETHTESTSNPKKREAKKRKEMELRSRNWLPYNVLKVKEGDVVVLKGECKVCKTVIAADTRRNGTSALKRHTDSCSLRHAKEDNQALLNLRSVDGDVGSGSLLSWRFDQKASRIALCDMILLDELPFRFIEHEGFKKFVSSICPQFNIPTRKTIKEDCVKVFLDRKEVLKSFFAKKATGKVSITTDCWTAMNNMSYICVTAHYIGHDWKLNKKIISFRKIAGHKGEDIADSIIETLSEWNMMGVLCCTMDNASANDKAIDYLKGYLDTQRANILGGKYLHLRCVAHIINLIVSDGLEEIGMSVRRVREAVKWIKGSPKRIDQFQKCVTALQINCKKFFSLDVPTRWNSTYLMLKAAEPYEAALKVFTSVEPTFVSDLLQKKYNDLPIGVPEEHNWVNVRKMMEYLKKFYNLTCLVSGTSYVTSNLVFKEICDLFVLISKLENSTDIEVALMASKMKKKVGKYWLETDNLNPKMNKVLYIAAVLDPRQKISYVEKCLKKVYGNFRANELASEVSDSMTEMFELYKKLLTPTPTQSQTSAPSQSSYQQHLDEGDSDFRGSFMVSSSDDEEDDSDCSELTVYLTEKHKDIKSESFDILSWWSKHGLRFPVLSEMAKDILAIPVSTVASESAFSTGGRVLDEFRSSLSPTTVEALICAEDWLRSSSTKKKTDREDEFEEEQEETFRNVLSSVGLRV